MSIKLNLVLIAQYVLWDFAKVVLYIISVNCVNEMYNVCVLSVYRSPTEGLLGIC